MDNEYGETCQFCGKGKFKGAKEHRGHERFCRENPNRLVPNREVKDIEPDPRLADAEGIESLAAISPLMTEEKMPSSDLSKDLKLVELESEKFANSLNPTQAKKYVTAVKREELLKKLGAPPAMMQNDGDNGSMFGGLAQELEAMNRISLRSAIMRKQLTDMGYISDGAKKDDSNMTLRELAILERMDRSRERGDQSEKIKQLEQARVEDAIKSLTSQLQTLMVSKTSDKDLAKQLENLKSTFQSLQPVFGKSEDESAASFATKLISNLASSPAVSNLTAPLGEALAARVAGPRAQGYQPPLPENQLAQYGDVPQQPGAGDIPPVERLVKVPSAVPGEYVSATENEAIAMGFGNLVAPVNPTERPQMELAPQNF